MHRDRSTSGVSRASLHCDISVKICFINPKDWDITHIKPAPPVIRMFLTSGSDSNLVLPVRIGASFQASLSSGNSAIGGDLGKLVSDGISFESYGLAKTGLTKRYLSCLSVEQ